MAQQRRLMLHMFATKILRTLNGKKKVTDEVFNLNDYKGYVDDSMYSSHDNLKAKFGDKVTRVLG